MYRITNKMRKIIHIENQFMNQALMPLGINVNSCNYLISICGKPGITQDQLARGLCIDKSNVARQTAALEEKGYIKRRTKESDRRVTQLYPTEKSLELLPECQGFRKDWEKMVMCDFSEEEMNQMETLLDKMKERAKQWKDVKDCGEA